MKIRIIIWCLVLLVPTFPTVLSIESSTYRSGKIPNKTMIENTNTVSNSFSKVHYYYMTGSYWTGEIVIQLDFYANSTIYLQSTVTKKAEAFHDVQLSKEFLTNSTFTARIRYSREDFFAYITNSKMNLVDQWQTEFSNKPTKGYDGPYYRRILNVTAENGSKWSAVNGENEAFGIYSSDLNSAFSLNYTLNLMREIIWQYNLNKTQNGQSLDLPTGIFPILPSLKFDTISFLMAICLTTIFYKKRKN